MVLHSLIAFFYFEVASNKKMLVRKKKIRILYTNISKPLFLKEIQVVTNIKTVYF